MGASASIKAMLTCHWLAMKARSWSRLLCAHFAHQARLLRPIGLLGAHHWPRSFTPETPVNHARAKIAGGASNQTADLPAAAPRDFPARIARVISTTVIHSHVQITVPVLMASAPTRARVPLGTEECAARTLAAAPRFNCWAQPRRSNCRQQFMRLEGGSWPPRFRSCN